jgi:hypothetical protein
VLFALAALLTGCGSTPPEELAKIKTWAEVQDLVNAEGKTKVVVWAENTSDKTFSGTIEVRSYDLDGKSLGFDGFYPKDLAPGKKAYGITWLKVSNPPRIETKVSSGTFK